MRYLTRTFFAKKRKLGTLGVDYASMYVCTVHSELLNAHPTKKKASIMLVLACLSQGLIDTLDQSSI